MTKQNKKKISIIMPARNEELNLPRAYGEVTKLFAEKLSEYDFEVTIIDNDSTDNTASVSSDICQRDNKWRYLKFSRNFGSETSIAAGLKYSTGDAMIILFSDLQDPPELIPEFISKWNEGFDVVCGKLKKRTGDVWWKKLGAYFAYFILDNFTDIRIPRNITDFRLMSRKVVDAVNRMDERNRYFRGLACWVGFKWHQIEYERKAREKGESKAPFYYLIDFTIRALTNFSITPLRFFSGAGFSVMFFTLIYAFWTFVQYLAGATVPGLTTVYLLLLLNLAFLCLGIGTLGEYIGRIYLETKRRPLWIVEREINIGLDKDQLFG